MRIGLDKIGFYAPQYYIEMSELAQWRDTDPDKYKYGLGQDQMAIAPNTQDTLTMAVNAAHSILSEEDKQAIDLVLFATESGLDQSKALSIYALRLLGIQPRTRCVELKEACYAATIAIMMAKDHILAHPDKKVLVLSSDISKYGLYSSGEPTQGAGAVALLVSKDPRIAIIEDETAYYSDDVMDFWRPNYSEVAFVQGKFSNEQYSRFFHQTFDDYRAMTGRGFDDFQALCFHIPYTKLGLKALKSVVDEDSHFLDIFQKSITFNRRVGNIYTGSVFLSLLSLLDSGHLKGNDRIGLFSYGSGAVGEFFSLLTVEGYENNIPHDIEENLDKRIKLTREEYETMYPSELPTDGSRYIIDDSNDQSFCVLEGIDSHIRLYKTKG
ncbi:hydroxymethylglutaryl-CoA synthase [Erysipelothrix larvae]|uniref:Hydroxymethylglutaryl-CoA synthase n=1 Tax=Erysipelothrix larvae TaxID=1514105 RepID=A0A109UHN9_9FIRM|nr:hydroxymethylglutaryl-CoA synthase [Erysipelothrix larvae]AMC94532.1 hydroxymethylglutaryl-CoA synthase [Erysipelothrix larvae]